MGCPTSATCFGHKAISPLAKLTSIFSLAQQQTKHCRVSCQGNTSSWSNSWHDSRILKIAKTLHHWWPPPPLELAPPLPTLARSLMRCSSSALGPSKKQYHDFTAYLKIVSNMIFNWQKMQTSCAPMAVLMLDKANPSRFRTWPCTPLMISLSSNSVDSWLQKWSEHNTLNLKSPPKVDKWQWQSHFWTLTDKKSKHWESDSSPLAALRSTRASK